MRKIQVQVIEPSILFCSTLALISFYSCLMMSFQKQRIFSLVSKPHANLPATSKNGRETYLFLNKVPMALVIYEFGRVLKRVG